MVDYKAWGTVDPIAVEDAAYLWAGIDPSTYSFTLTAEQRGAFTARLKMLTVRIQSKTLSAKTDSNPAAFIGVHDKSLVTRADLRVVAEALGERPAFLFFNEPLEGHSTAVARPDSELVRSRDGQHRAMQKQAIEALSHRPSSPRRVSNAPPPPPTVGGGGVVWGFPPEEVGRAPTDQSLSVAAGTVDSAQAKQQLPLRASLEGKEAAAVEPTVARRAGRPVGAGGNREHLDADLVREVLEAVETGRAKSFLSAATAIQERIPGGGTPESRSKRIAAKASAAASLKATS